MRTWNIEDLIYTMLKSMIIACSIEKYLDWYILF